MDMKKTLFTIGRLELSRDFVLFMLAFGILITILLYSPNEIRNVLNEIKNLGAQNGELAEQGVNNTEKIINTSAQRFNASTERTVTILNELRQYINSSEAQQQSEGLDIIKVLFLYLEDMERDNNKIMTALNLTNEHYVSINGTHAITENGAILLPYEINITSSLPDLNINQSPP